MAERINRLAGFLAQPEPRVTAAMVGGWEGGEAISASHLSLLCAVLEIPVGDLVGLLDPLALPEWSAPPRLPGIMGLEDSMLRRDFLRRAAVLGGVVAVDPERLTAALGQHGHVDQVLVRQLRFAIRTAAGEYDRLSAPLLRQRSAGLAEAAKALLAGPLPPTLRRELLSVAAEGAVLAGWAWRSDGRPQQAAAFYDMAETMASAAEDSCLLGFVLSRQADLHSGVQKGLGQAGDTGPVRPLLDRAENLVDASAPSALRAHILLRQAEEHAAAGDGAEGGRYLDRADTAFAISDVGKDGMFGIPWHLRTHIAYRGNVLHLAGRHTQAAAVLEGVLRRLPPGVVSNRSAAMADLGAAYAAQDELDYACALLADAFTIAKSAGLDHRAERVRGIRQQYLAEWADTRQVRMLDDLTGGHRA